MRTTRLVNKPESCRCKQELLHDNPAVFVSFGKADQSLLSAGRTPTCV